MDNLAYQPDISAASQTPEELAEAWAGMIPVLPQGYLRIPDEVVLRAGEDERFARYLAECRSNPGMLGMLFSDRANRRYHRDAEETPRGRRSTLRLVAGAARSLARWSATAFESTPAEEAERRLTICRACPHSAGIELAPAITRFTTTEATICGLCGCPLGRKARMASEHCPGEDPLTPGHNRWGQPTERGI